MMAKRLSLTALTLVFLFYPMHARAQEKKEGEKKAEADKGSQTAPSEEEKVEVEEEAEAPAGAKIEQGVEEEVEVEEETEAGHGAGQEEVKEAVDKGKAKGEEEIEPIEKAKAPVTEELPPPGLTLVQNDWASLKFIGVFAQYFRFTASGIGNDYEDTNPGAGGNADNDVEFVTKRIRTILTGSFWGDRVSFLLQGDLTETALFNRGEEDSGFLLDARVNVFPFKGFGPEALGGLGIAFGRFIPDFTYYMPRNVGLLDFVEYPLVTSSFAPWRQIGAQLMFDHKYVEAAAGIYNGMRFRSKDDGNSDRWMGNGYLAATLGDESNLSDDNNAKDFLVKVKGKYPDYGIWVEAFSYFSMPEFYQGGSHSFGYAITFGGEAGIEHRFTDELKLKFIGGFTGRRISFPTGALCDGDPCDPYVQMGFFVHAGVLIGRWVEPMVRVDWLNDRGEFLTIHNVVGLAKDEAVWTIWPSVGVRFPLYGDHLQLTLVDTFKHYANPHQDDSNDLTLQLILLL